MPKSAKTLIWHMAQAGPLARTLEDIEILWKVIVGPHESDRNIPRIEWRPSEKKSLPEYKIAWVDRWPDYPVSEQVSGAIQEFVAKLEQHGCKVENQPPDGNLHEETLEVYSGILPYILAQGLPWFVRPLLRVEFKSTFGKGQTKHRKEFQRALRMSANHYGEMLLRRNIAISRWEYFFKDYDFLICPSAFGPAYPRTKVGNKIRYAGNELIYSDYVAPYMACFNASGNPAMNIPLKFGQDGLPLGLQIVGPYWSEPELIAFAKHASQLTEGFVKPAGY